jgi:drug/metabolite transporter (DMT)-like permease
MRPTASPIAVWAGLIVLYLVWGSTYLGIKVAIDTIPPFVMGFLRFVPAGILLAGAVALRYRRSIRRPTRRELVDTAIVGGFLLMGGMGLVAWAELTVPTGIAALLIALMPMWLAIFGLVFLGERLPRAGVVGIAVGVVGVAILAWPTSGVDDLDPAGLLALLVSPIFWSLGSIYAARRAVLPSPALFASGLEMIAGGLVLLVAGAITGELATFDPATVSTASWVGIAYLLLVGSLVGYTTFAWLVQVAPLPRVATYAYVNPVVAVILGAIVLQEPLSPRTWVASVVIIAAVVLIVTARARVRPAAASIEPVELDELDGDQEQEPAAA